MEITMQRKSIDLPINVLARLSEMAAVSGQSLKCFMESVLEGKAMECNNPSPSNDPWFDDGCNIRIVNKGIEQLKNGEGREYTAAQLKERLGV